MQIILNDAEAKEYLRLKAIVNADIDLAQFENSLDYFYNTQLVPIYARTDLKRYPEKPSMLAVDAEESIRKLALTLLDMVAKLRAKLKLQQNTNKE